MLIKTGKYNSSVTERCIISGTANYLCRRDFQNSSHQSKSSEFFMRKFYIPVVTEAFVVLDVLDGYTRGLLKGRVRDALTKKCLPGASVLIKYRAR